MIDKSRILLHHSERESTLLVKNTGDTPIIIQTWIDDGNTKSTPEDSADYPALSLPSIVKLNVNEQVYVRIINKFSFQHKEKESMYWLNIHEISPKSEGANIDEKALSVSVRLQMKIFYRPDNLENNISDVSSKLIFKKSGSVLNIENPTPFHTVFSYIQDNSKQEHKLYFIEPFSKKHIPTLTVLKSVNYGLIDDNGKIFSDSRDLN